MRVRTKREKIAAERALRDFLAEHSLLPIGKHAWAMFQELRAELIARDSDLIQPAPPYRNAPAQHRVRFVGV
jgi:hypothetical protein